MSDKPVNHPKHAKGSKGLIFVVDDEPMLLELATVILEPLGYAVKTFRDPQSALKSYTDAKPRPVLVITDFSMHRMNGLELLDACRRLHPDQRVLMISGTVDETIYRNSPSKPDLFIAKPYHAKQLVQAVRQLLASKHEGRNGEG